LETLANIYAKNKAFFGGAEEHKDYTIHTSGSKPIVFISSLKKKASSIRAPFIVPAIKE